MATVLVIVAMCAAYWVYLVKTEPAVDDRAALPNPVAAASDGDRTPINGTSGRPIGSVRVAGVVAGRTSSVVVLDIDNRSSRHLILWGNLSLRSAAGRTRALNIAGTSIDGLRPNVRGSTTVAFTVPGRWTTATPQIGAREDLIRMPSGAEVVSVEQSTPAGAWDVEFRWNTPYRYVRSLVSVICVRDGRVVAAGSAPGEISGGRTTGTAHIASLVGDSRGASCGGSAAVIAYQLKFKPNATKYGSEDIAQ